MVSSNFSSLEYQSTDYLYDFLVRRFSPKFSALLPFCKRNPLVTSGFASQRDHDVANLGWMDSQNSIYDNSRIQLL